MGFKLLPLPLALLVFGCPLWCSLSNGSPVDACCRAKPAANQGCCDRATPDDCGRGQQSQKSPATPGDPCPCDDCQCICGGALYEHRVVDPQPVDDISFDDVLLAQVALSDTLFRQRVRTFRHQSRGHQVSVAGRRSGPVHATPDGRCIIAVRRHPDHERAPGDNERRCAA